MKDVGRRLVRLAGRVVAFGRARAAAVGELWRTSLQFKVTASTLALSSAVVFMLVMVLQYQIAERLLDAKEKAALSQARSVLETARGELAGVDVNPDTLRERLESARKKITFDAPDAQGTAGSAAGAFEPVLVGGSVAGGDEPVAAGDYWKVPESLRSFVEQRQETKQIHTAGGKTYLIIGEPMTAATGRPLQLYLLFPLTAEQNTVSTVQNTFLVGGFVLLLLVASIANLVTRQVVLPVRRAANAAGRFAEGDFDKRLPVTGKDDLSKLAVSYNEMAESIQQQIQQLEEFGQLQRRFTSDVSHELRTPLTTVRMAADVLHASREQFPPGLARSTELLVDELDRFEALLGDLLEISRLDAGVEELAAEYIDLKPILERVREQVRVVAGNAGTPIELVLPEGEVAADVDARRVERILRNLVANAVDHSEGKPVRVTMAVSDDAVAVAVRDYGVGLRPGEEELVFNRFWRADPSRNRHTGGTGLGLSISQEDARLHGGELVSWGEPGHGACFRLTLPREQGRPFTTSPLGLPPDPPATEAPPAPAPDVSPGPAPEALPAATGNGFHAAAPAEPNGEQPTADREEVGR